MALQLRQARGDRRVQGTRDLLAVDARDERLADVRLLQCQVALRTELDVDVLPGVADLLVNDELLVLEEVGDLELRLRLHDLALTSLQGLESGVRVEDVAEHDTVELQLRTGSEGRVLAHGQLHTLLPAVEAPRTAGDGNRRQEHLVHVLTLDDVRRVDAARDEGLPVGVRLLEDDRGLLAATADRPHVLPTRPADDVVRRVGEDLPRRAEGPSR